VEFRHRPHTIPLRNGRRRANQREVFVSHYPGEVRTVRLTPADLSYWTAATRGWVQDEITFEVYAGNSSQASLKTTFEVRNR
jgi:hypothetical protein